MFAMFAVLFRLASDLVTLAVVAALAFIAFAVLFRVVGMNDVTAAWTTFGLVVDSWLALDFVGDQMKPLL